MCEMRPDNHHRQRPALRIEDWASPGEKLRGGVSALSVFESLRDPLEIDRGKIEVVVKMNRVPWPIVIVGHVWAVMSATVSQFST